MPTDDDEEGQRIAQELRLWRRKTADEMNVPPYVIFGDKTLFDIALKKPHSSRELLNCNGIGENKARSFGDSILRIVRG
ncbi:MAG: HRDC domain-containing protein [Treponema sp.]|nr:HRDC domain-containing protein [Treponema sp.]